MREGQWPEGVRTGFWAHQAQKNKHGDADVVGAFVHRGLAAGRSTRSSSWVLLTCRCEPRLKKTDAIGSTCEGRTAGITAVDDHPVLECPVDTAGMSAPDANHADHEPGTE